MRELNIAGKRIADDSPAWIIAEVGHNHQGSVEKCKQIFKSAAECGVNAVKLQKRDNKALFTHAMYKSPYIGTNAFGPTYGAHREALELGWDEYVELKGYAEALGLVFFATAFDIPSADFLEKLGVPCFKIASGCLTDLPLIRHVASYGKPMLISTGGGTPQDVKRVYHTVKQTTCPFALLQCTASYPASPEEMNLRVIETYRNAFPETVIGLSDHYNGIADGPLAFALGARIFEKHFTINRAWKGSDQAFSLEHEGMRRFVRDIQRTPALLGDGIKRVYESEAAGMYKMAKGLVPTEDFPAGHVLQPGDLESRSPLGLPPWKADKLYGRQLREPLTKGQTITTSGIVEA